MRAPFNRPLLTMSEFVTSTPVHGRELFALHRRRVLVTGSGQGIGLTLARGFAAAGAELVLNDIDAARLGCAVQGLRDEGVVVSGQAFNVAVEAEVVAGVAEIF